MRNLLGYLIRMLWLVKATLLVNKLKGQGFEVQRVQNPVQDCIYVTGYPGQVKAALGKIKAEKMVNKADLEPWLAPANSFGRPVKSAFRPIEKRVFKVDSRSL